MISSRTARSDSVSKMSYSAASALAERRGCTLAQLLHHRGHFVLVQEVQRRVELLEIHDARRLGLRLLPDLLLDLRRRRRGLATLVPTASGTTSSPKPSTNW
jgi:hypothetical protein